MKKVLIAMDNEILLSQIKKCGKYLTYGYDIDTKENVLEYLSKNEVDILVTKDTLNGEIEFKEYIREIKKLQCSIKIVVVVSCLTEDIKGFLLANDVNNIIEGECVAFSKVIEMIDSKNGLIEEKKTLKNISNNNTKVITKQKILFFSLN